MALSLDNFNKPSNRKWKAVADVILYTLPLYLGAVMALPISDTWKLWVNFGVTIVTITIKGISKLTLEEEHVMTPEETKISNNKLDDIRKAL
jgi:hypothetical protein